MHAGVRHAVLKHESGEKIDATVHDADHCFQVPRGARQVGVWMDG